GAIASGEAFGTLLLRFDQVISLTGIASAEAFGATTVAGGAVLGVTGIASAEAVGTPSLLGQIAPTGIASAEAVGTPTLIPEQFITLTGIASAEAFGTAELIIVVPPIAPTPILSTEAFGRPTLTATGASTVSPTSITTAEAVAAPQATQTPLPVQPTPPGVPTPPLPTPPLPAVVPAVVIPRVANRFYDPTTDTAYDWILNQATEEPVLFHRESTLGAPNADIGLVRQVRPGDELALRLAGTILHPAQRTDFDAFYAACADHALHYTDFLGNAYEVVITALDIRRERVLWNRQTGQPFLYRWTMELEITTVLSAPEQRMGVT
ncbi:MAG TPA: hypothetical protein VNS83_03315, partial [Lapillicoccus sp.]|nr:hypothetical protein [Lapillicoccus sp.]